MSRIENADNRFFGTIVPTQNLMPSQIASTDEFILAAFLSGQLPDPLRKEIITYLTNSGQARDILTMAQDALDSAGSGDGMPAAAVPVPAPGDGLSTSRTTAAPVLRKRLDERTLWKVTAVFAGAVLVLALIVMALVLDPSRQIARGEDWSPRVSGDNLELAWPVVPGATSYQILMFDAATHQARVLGAVQGPQIDLDGLTASSSGQLSILALDDGGRVISRSIPMSVSAR